MSIESVAGGLIGATYLVPISIAFCLATNHGKYLPLWLPYAGLVGAYVSYALAEAFGAPTALALAAGIMLPAALSVIVHFALFRGYVERKDLYPALLRGIAITVLVEAALGWATHGYALSYSHLRFGGAVYVPSLSETITVPDLVAALLAITLAPLLALVLRRTWIGLVFRSVSSNRGLASDYGLPVNWVDAAVMAACGSLSAVGAIMFAMKYDLSPQMLSEPTMKVAAVVVAFGTEWPERIAAGILAIGIVEAATQSSPANAPFASAIGYVLLIGALLIRYSVPAAWKKRLEG